jgi:hypothetical protein
VELALTLPACVCVCACVRVWVRMVCHSARAVALIVTFDIAFAPDEPRWHGYWHGYGHRVRERRWRLRGPLHALVHDAAA